MRDANAAEIRQPSPVIAGSQPASSARPNGREAALNCALRALSKGKARGCSEAFPADFFGTKTRSAKRGVFW